MAKLRGYRYRICEVAPGTDGWDSIRYMDHRDNLEDAQKIITILQETDIMWTTYMILAEPVYAQDNT